MPSKQFLGIRVSHPSPGESPHARNHSLGWRMRKRGGVNKQNPISLRAPIMHIDSFKSDDCNALTTWAKSGGRLIDLNNLAYYQNLSDLPQSSKVTGFWKLEEASGDFIDETGNNNLELLGGTSDPVYQANGKVGYCADWTTVGKHVVAQGVPGPPVGLPAVMPAFSISNQSLTIAIWVKVASTGLTGAIMTGVDTSGALAYRLKLNAGKIEFNLGGLGIITGDTVISANTWQLLTGIYTYVGAGTSKLDAYLDNVPDATQVTGVGALSVDVMYVNVGESAWTSLLEPGLIALYDEIAFWKDAALTPADVIDLYDIPYG